MFVSRLRTIVHHLSHSRPITMTTVHNTNEACCSIPPVVTSDYTPKGTIKPYGAFQSVYITGPEKSDNAIICIFDIFGFFPQTQQGADILASALNTTVLMPDFFEPAGPFSISKFPPKDDAAKAELQAFFGGTANPQENAKKLIALGQKLKEDGYKKLGVYGTCWGGKVTMLVGAESSLFTAVSILHPAMIAEEDAKKLQVPLAIYVSKDEPKAEYEKMLEVIKNKPFADKCDHKNYSNMFHGWAAARADLKNEENKKEYEDVYGRLANFFTKNLA